jgi:superfamily II DNA or RNA helicase
MSDNFKKIELKGFRYYQVEADNAIYEELLVNRKCIVKMFCGTGKSLLMRKCKSAQNKKLVVYVFPSLSLIDQFCNDYFDKTNCPFKISSENGSTTDSTQIKAELKKKKNKIICVTYQSYNTLLDNLGSIKIDVCIYDEAHHAVAPTYKKLIFERNDCEKQIFFTATPKDDNGTVMCDKDTGICGKTVYDYSYLRGMNEGYLNPLEIRVDMYTENTNKSVYESIARAILVSGNNRVLTFHADVNTDRDTSVINFVDEKEFIRAFMKVLIDEFPKKAGLYTTFKMIALDASIRMNERRTILDKFDTTSDNEVYIISSCETIGEGIDTKNASMCVFVDPKSSFVKIIQNIGRIVRKQKDVYKPPSTVLIPCWVDKTKYVGCDEDREKCDEVIRSDLNKDGNFNGILNVLSALRQEDEDLYDICLHYPDTYSPQEIKSNLEKHGYKVLDRVGDGELIETMESLLEADIDYEDCETNEEMILRIAEDNNVCVEVHTNSFENQIEKYNSDCESGEIIRLYKEEIDEDEENQVYCPIVEKCGKRKGDESIKELDRKDRIKIDVHTNPDILVLWKLVGDFTKEICSCILECEVVDTWLDKFEELKNYIDENNKRPSSESKDDNEQKLGVWWQRQQTLYKNKKQGMKNIERYDLWTNFLEDYKEYFISDDEKWIIKLDLLKNFIDENNRRPIKESKNEDEKNIGVWLGQQLNDYKNKIKGMKNEERYDLWTEFLEDYKECFISKDVVWDHKFDELKKFINENNTYPSQKSGNENEKKIGQWLSQQNNNYKNKKRSMNDELRYNLWTEFLEENKKYLITKDVVWDNKFYELKEFIDKNNKKPTSDSKQKNEKTLGQWLQAQMNYYKNKDSGMKNEERYDLWSNFLEDYKELFISDDEKWDDNFKKLKEYLIINKKLPRQKSDNEDEKKISNWYTSQQKKYKEKTEGMKNSERYDLWSKFLEEYNKYIDSFDKRWSKNLDELKDFINKNKKKPSQHSKNNNEKSYGLWLIREFKKYKDNKLEDKIRYDLFTEFLEEYKQYFDNNIEDKSVEEIIIPKPKKSMKLKEPKTKEPKETPEQRQHRTKSELSVLHQRYKTLTSQNLQKEFQETPELWHKYHAISEENEKSFLKEGIPRNRIINELNEIKTKRTRSVVDMGCGKAQIADHFENDKRFTFINYDHVSSKENILVQDISNTGLEDDSVEICILCLAMWGSNCHDYVREAHRILESGGKLYIMEATKRWTTDGDEAGKRLKSLLEESGFQITKQSVEKFCLFVCTKA